MRTTTAGILVLLLVAPAMAQDVVLDWNNVYIDTIRQAGGTPGGVSWTGAMVHAAIYDAYNSYDHLYQPYLGYYDVPAGGSADLTAAAAAHGTLSALYPQYKSTYDAALAQSIERYGGSCSNVSGSLAMGQSVATAMCNTRQAALSTFDGPWPDGTEAGQWRPTEPDYSGAVGATLPNATPWVAGSTKVLAPPPPALTSAEYAAAYNEVKSKGALDSTTRTPHEEAIAAFWANDRDGTYKPPGQLNDILQKVSQQRGLTTAQNARVFALLNIAMADGGIASWTAKYRDNLWRPVTGIREGDNDGNPLTDGDPTWQPLSNEVNGFTPPFPAYSSGHSTFAGVFASVMKDYFGDDRLEMYLTTDDSAYTGDPLYYATFSQAAEDDALSRIPLGVHWRFDCTEGLANGQIVGNYVFYNALLPMDPNTPIGWQDQTPGVIPEPLTALAVTLAVGAIGWRVRKLRRHAMA